MANKLFDKLDGILLEIKLSSKKELLTFDDAVLILGCSKSYLYKLTSNRQVPHFKPCGKTIFFKRSELMKWVENSRVPTQDEMVQNHRRRLNNK